jgi:choline dehydrogenase
MARNAAFDFIVIGAGSAGATVAGRLAEDGRHTVLLIEAGPKDDHIHIRMPAALGMPLMSTRFNWFYHTEPEPNLGGRRVYEARGRALGGSSSINGLNWVRGNPWDYDNWAALGLAGWSYADVLPYFKRAETFDKGASQYRGGGGPMRVETCPADHALFQIFLQAGVQAGYAMADDHNAFRQEGIHVTQRNTHGGVRWNTARAYLHEAGPRPNLTVRTGTRVTRIEFAGTRAVRVHAVSHGATVAFDVGREVVVSGGTLNSPQVLMLSGIGDADHLRSIAIPVTHHLPGVGRGLKDHMSGTVQSACKEGVSLARQLGRLGRVKVGLEWILLKQGIGTTNYFEVGAFIRTEDSIKVPNMQIEFIPLLGNLHHGGVEIGDGFQYYFNLLRPTSEGRVWIDSADPMAAPKFVFNYMATEQDRRHAVASIKVLRDLIAQQAWASIRTTEITPGPAVRTDDEILGALVADIAGTNYHPCRSCRMGTDNMAVTDAEGRVRGLDNIRVVDASIMPEIVSGNLNAPTIMIAEKLSDSLLGKAPLPPEPAPYYRA